MLRPSADPYIRQRKKNAPPPPKGLRAMIPAIGGSAVAITIIMFAMGKLPVVEAMGGNINTTLQSHNDAIVGSFIHALPSLAVGFGLLLAISLVWLNRSAKTQKAR